jgi:hypothetical protein
MQYCNDTRSSPTLSPLKYSKISFNTYMHASGVYFTYTQSTTNVHIGAPFNMRAQIQIGLLSWSVRRFVLGGSGSVNLEIV